MQELFNKHISKNFSFVKQAKILIATSGGIDSVVLTHLCKNAGLTIALAHCNFKLRGNESDADEAFVKTLATDLNIPVYTTYFNTLKYKDEHKVSVQMAARELRYNWFASLIDEYNFDCVFTAHHADDNLETFLINLSRGTGIEGLMGIPSLYKNTVRPLLPFTREEIENFAVQHGIIWREDSSNEESKYLRNKLRLEVIPELKSVNTSFMDNFNKTIRFIQGTSQIVRNHLEELKQKLFVFEEDRIIINAERLKELSPRKDYLFGLFNEYGFREWNDVESLLFSSSGKQVFSETHRMLKNREEIIITPIKPIEIEDYYSLEKDVGLDVSGLRLVVYDVGLTGPFKNNLAYIDKDLLKYPLIVRKWKKGDYFYPLGMQNKKLLSKFFKDEKFSILDKENAWILCSGNEIVWVIDHRIDDRYKVTSKTKNILKIEHLK